MSEQEKEQEKQEMEQLKTMPLQEETLLDEQTNDECVIVGETKPNVHTMKSKVLRIPLCDIVNLKTDINEVFIEYYEEEKKSALLEHAKKEFEYGGYDISEKGCNPPNPKEPMDGYVNSCAKNAFELLEVFAKAGHSGLSAGITLHLFNKLAKWENLTPLTNNPDEWNKIEYDKDGDYQNKRNSACFTNDFKTYWNIDEEENKIRTSDNSFTMKPKAEWVKHQLKDYKENK